MLPQLPNLIDGSTFKTNAITYQYTNGVSLTKYIDVLSPNENALYYQVHNHRNRAVEVTISIDAPTEWRKYIKMPKESVVKKRIPPRKEVAIVRIISKQEYDKKTARDALTKITFRIEWKTLKSERKKYQ